MKISYKHLIKHITTPTNINEMSERLFQLGHEHTIDNNVFDIEFTPNRGDCLSVFGLLRDLKPFYKIELENKSYEKNLKPLNMDFENNALESCPSISFLKIEIDKPVSKYQGSLENYFSDLDNKQINFFTDISNYISYEMGQPTHCYDASKIDGKLSLNESTENCKFHTLLDTEIQLKNKNLVFSLNDKIINLAGVIGDKDSSCSKDTVSAIIECAYFKPEKIIGKSIEYNINSDAAYKFERGVDISCHERVLRRFIQIVKEHTNIIQLAFFNKNYIDFKKNRIKYDAKFLSQIIGIDINKYEYEKIFSKLGLKKINNYVEIPPYRSDLASQNDLAEEISRVIGYDNIPRKEFTIPSKNKELNLNEAKLKKYLTSYGFSEVINFPFVSENTVKSIKVDNSLDSNKEFLRTNLKKSLINNLIYNERRQKDSIKLFEVSDVYSYDKDIKKQRMIGIIASGRVGNNYEEFSSIIDKKYLKKILNSFLKINESSFESVSRESLSTKSKHPITYLEIDLSDFEQDDFIYDDSISICKSFITYQTISDFPVSTRDVSFSITNYDGLKKLEDDMLSYKNKILKESFIFDYYENIKIPEIKLGFRFVFQAGNRTITDHEVDQIINDIIDIAYKIDTVKVPGM